jgi:NAD(P)-dependent dehydrogenase (short-subunit alcohol dehydrogenase family)
MPTVLITGANRGIGLELAKQYAGDGWSVIATARDAKNADGLKALKGDIRIEALEFTD